MFNQININYLMSFFSQFGVLVLIFSGMIGGEELIIGLVFLAISGLFPLWWILVYVTVGELISDIFVFSLGKIKLPAKIKDTQKIKNLYKKTDDLIIKISKKSTFRAILYSKFIYGTRVLTLLYLSSKKIKWIKFFRAEIFVLTIWMTAVVTISYLIGSGLKQFGALFNNIKITISSLLFFIIFIIIIKKWIQVKLLKKQKQ